MLRSHLCAASIIDYAPHVRLFKNYLISVSQGRSEYSDLCETAAGGRSRGELRRATPSAVIAVCSRFQNPMEALRTARDSVASRAYADPLKYLYVLSTPSLKEADHHRTIHEERALTASPSLLGQGLLLSEAASGGAACHTQPALIPNHRNSFVWMADPRSFPPTAGRLRRSREIFAANRNSIVRPQLLRAVPFWWLSVADSPKILGSPPP